MKRRIERKSSSKTLFMTNYDEGERMTKCDQNGVVEGVGQRLGGSRQGLFELIVFFLCFSGLFSDVLLLFKCLENGSP